VNNGTDAASLGGNGGRGSNAGKPANGNPANGNAAPRRAVSPVATGSATTTTPNGSAPQWMGKRVGKFKLTGLLGQGAMGRVFRAEDTLLRRQVALKVLPKVVKRGQRTVEAARLVCEARAAAALEHPNAVQVFEVGDVGGVYYIAMELVEAGSLRDLVEGQGPLDHVRASQLAAEAAEALGHAHAVGIVHRDVKPANLLLTRTGRVKVADFGLARVEDPSDLTNFLAESVGTPQFVAPEILQGVAASAKSDMYSLAATLWYLLTGKPPFEAGTAEDLLQKHISAPLPNLKRLRPDLPDSLVRTIYTALAKEPSKRHGTAEQFASALRVHCIPVGGASSTSLTHMPLPPVAQPPSPARRRRRWAIPVASLAGVIAVAAVVFAVMAGRGFSPERLLARGSGNESGETSSGAAPRQAPAAAAKPAPTDPLPQSSERRDESGDSTEPEASSDPDGGAAAAVVPKSPKPAPKPAPRHDKVVDLLKLIEPAVATVSGGWRFDRGDLVTEKAKPGTLQIPYKPPAEYDFRIEFTTDGTVQQHLYKEPFSFSYAMGTSHDCGFEYFEGKHVWDSGYKSTQRITPGKRHTSLVRVREGRLQAWLDDKLLIDAATDYKPLSKNPELAQLDNSLLGLGSYDAVTRFHTVEVIEITQGEGS